MKPILLVAAAALIDVDGRVLICKRPQGKHLAGMWEFPGGKVEEGETPEACLIRELNEELGIRLLKRASRPSCLPVTLTIRFTYSCHFTCAGAGTGVVLAKEHEAIAWVKPNKMGDYPMPPADAPLVAWLRDLI